MKYVGAHVSIAGGVQNAPGNAHQIGAMAFALFTKNQRQWKAKPLSADSIAEFRRNCDRHGFSPEYILPHDSYLINLGHPEAEGLTKSRDAFLEECQRCQQLGLKYLNFHPGSHLGQSSEKACLQRIAQSINWTLAQTSDVVAVIENTSGQGHQVGYRFEHLAEIIHQVEDKSRIGVCLDTCHAYTAGYDLKDPQGYQFVLQTFENTVGLSFLKAMHLNRHAGIGQGTLGLTTFRHIMQDPRLDGIPLILETPDPTRWPEEIRQLRSMA
jgi:deoxyribonuclease-4